MAVTLLARKNFAPCNSQPTTFTGFWWSLFFSFLFPGLWYLAKCGLLRHRQKKVCNIWPSEHKL